MRTEISGHYGPGDLLGRLRAALLADGVDPDHPTIEALAPYDQLHGRGMEATRELADQLQVSIGDRLLDVGSGIGGPARYIAERFTARVTGIDLTAEFCDVAQHLTQALGMDDRVDFKQGDALAMPFADASFDGAYSINVAMNIRDKAGFYAEIHRVLRPGGWLALAELAQGPNGSPAYPTPWARTEESSFLATPAQTRAGLEAAGFTVTRLRETTEQALAYGARARAMVERGEKPPQRIIQLIHGDLAREIMANVARGVAEGRLVPIEVLCTKPG
ncbi:MAG TPA: class I SAM-dependent methyltransferase [Geminicoccaceae bacterium]|nr:class I SAM-dependent methyltransferase [Geminicoccaceae bacterium]